MTEQEVKEFVEKVKGKKIRWSTWNDEEYFIPNGNYRNDHLYGMYYNNGSRKEYFWIHNGFEDHYGGCWEWCDEEDKALEDETPPPWEPEIEGEVSLSGEISEINYLMIVMRDYEETVAQLNKIVDKKNKLYKQLKDLCDFNDNYCDIIQVAKEKIGELTYKKWIKK